MRLVSILLITFLTLGSQFAFGAEVSKQRISFVINDAANADGLCATDNLTIDRKKFNFLHVLSLRDLGLISLTAEEYNYLVSAINTINNSECAR